MSVTINNKNLPYSVSSDGTDQGDLVASGGSMLVPSAGVADTTTVDAGGFLAIETGGTASGTILSGGKEIVSVGGRDLGALISGGGQGVYGTTRNAIVFAGAIEIVESGGIANF